MTSKIPGDTDIPVKHALNGCAISLIFNAWPSIKLRTVDWRFSVSQSSKVSNSVNYFANFIRLAGVMTFAAFLSKYRGRRRNKNSAFSAISRRLLALVLRLGNKDSRRPSRAGSGADSSKAAMCGLSSESKLLASAWLKY